MIESTDFQYTHIHKLMQHTTALMYAGGNRFLTGLLIYRARFQRLNSTPESGKSGLSLSLPTCAGINTLSRKVSLTAGASMQEGHAFHLTGKNANCLKVLVWDHHCV